MEFVYPGGKLVLTADETLNDSDKNIYVPTGKRWLLLHIRIEFTATATLGNRTLRIEVRDAADDIIWESEILQIAASQMGIMQFAPGLVRTTNDLPVANVTVMSACPAFILDAGYYLRIRDGAAVDVAVDDMIIQLMTLEIDI